MSWSEALRLTRALALDPTSHVAAAVAGWRHPWSHEAIVLANLYDLQHKIAAGKRTPKPHARPWDAQERKFGGGARLSKARLRALLDAHRRSAPAGHEESQLV